MSHWAESRTTALGSVEASLRTVESLLGLVKDGKGKPSQQERAVFAAAVVFLYGIWENYVEQLAIELVSHLSPKVAPNCVPDQVKKALEKKTAWELTVHPGWRSLWSEMVRVQAIGDDTEKFGMNTAKSGQVKNLLSITGVPDCFAEAKKDIIPAHLVGVSRVEDAVNKLVELRGEIVHTGKVPESLRKAHVISWEAFVRALCASVDGQSRKDCRAIT
jgi:hypothetical protein